MGGPNQLCEIASLKERGGKVWGGTECGLFFRMHHGVRSEVQTFTFTRVERGYRAKRTDLNLMQKHF